MVRFVSERGGVDGLVLNEIEPHLVVLILSFIGVDRVYSRARTGRCGRVEGARDGTDRDDCVGNGGVRRMIDGGIISISGGRCIWLSFGTRAGVVSGAGQSQGANYHVVFVPPKSRGRGRAGGGLGGESGRRGYRLMLVFVGRRPQPIRLRDNGTEWRRTA